MLPREYWTPCLTTNKKNDQKNDRTKVFHDIIDGHLACLRMMAAEKPAAPQRDVPGMRAADIEDAMLVPPTLNCESPHLRDDRPGIIDGGIGDPDCLVPPAINWSRRPEYLFEPTSEDDFFLLPPDATGQGTSGTFDTNAAGDDVLLPPEANASSAGAKQARQFVTQVADDRDALLPPPGAS